MKLITVNRLMISCWSLFNAEVVFLFFETSFDLLLKVCLLFRIVRLAGVSCLCFSFFLLVVHIFFVGIYRYFWYLSLISFLVDYSLVFGIFWLDLINEFFPACWLVVLVVIVVVHYIYAYVRNVDTFFKSWRYFPPFLMLFQKTSEKIEYIFSF